MTTALLDSIQQRYACRQFVAQRGVSSDELKLIQEAGRLAPSAFGLEPWRFFAVPDSQRAAVAEACYQQPAVTSAAELIAITALVAVLDPDSDYVRARFVAEARDGEIEPIYAAYRAHYHVDSIAEWARGQCNFAAAHMLLQATHIGLDSCPVGGFDADMLTRALALPAGECPALLIALGHCSYEAPERVRKPLE
jgi:nitroreductase